MAHKDGKFKEDKVYRGEYGAEEKMHEPMDVGHEERHSGDSIPGMEKETGRPNWGGHNGLDQDDKPIKIYASDCYGVPKITDDGRRIYRKSEDYASGVMNDDAMKIASEVAPAGEMFDITKTGQSELES